MKSVIQATWDDVPHLSPEAKAALWATIPPYQRDARTKGIPALGRGVVYQIPETEYTISDFALPASWPRGYGMDVGWNWTVATWGALNPETQTRYLYAEYYRSEAEPVVHAAGIRAKGADLPGRIDPAAGGRGQRDGQRLLDDYRALGLQVQPARHHMVESGIFEVWTLLSTGRLKIFASCRQLLHDLSRYHRDDKGRVVKLWDHGPDAVRYLIASGTEWLKAPGLVQKVHGWKAPATETTHGWMR